MTPREKRVVTASGTYHRIFQPADSERWWKLEEDNLDQADIIWSGRDSGELPWRDDPDLVEALRTRNLTAADLKPCGNCFEGELTRL